jgi:flavin reductase (DIM6/NTAB) family NADH-FMN oxidoreductase RutF
MSTEGIDLRKVMGHFVTGVAVITSRLDDMPCAMTANSLTSVSLDPPLVLFCALRGALTYKAIEDCHYYAINILDSTQEEIARRFAMSGPKSLRGVRTRPGHFGAPILVDALAWLDCSLWANYDGGDHGILIGQVHSAGTAHEGSPLTFYRGGYHALSD